MELAVCPRAGVGMSFGTELFLPPPPVKGVWWRVPVGVVQHLPQDNSMEALLIAEQPALHPEEGLHGNLKPWPRPGPFAQTTNS